MLLIALPEGVSQGWSTPAVIIVFALSEICLASFIYWQDHLETETSQPAAIDACFNNQNWAVFIRTTGHILLFRWNHKLLGLHNLLVC